jgi:hypothetical protein
MSHIPNSAMPHAGASQVGDGEGTKGSLAELADVARAHPKATAAGVAIVAGAAAAAIPLIRSRRPQSRKRSGANNAKKSA